MLLMKQATESDLKSLPSGLVLTMPRGATGITADDVRNAVAEIGYPVLIRPSYVLVAEEWKYCPMILS